MASNVLQSKSLPTCSISVQGPIEFNDPSAYHSGRMILGEIEYETKTFFNDPSGMVTVYYLDNESLSTFDYSNWLPMLVVGAKFDDWNACRHLADPVLSTLGLP